MLSEKTHDTVRRLQIWLEAAAFAMASLTASVDLGRIGAIITAVIGAGAAFCGYIAKKDSEAWRRSVTVIDAAERQPADESEVLG